MPNYVDWGLLLQIDDNSPEMTFSDNLDAMDVLGYLQGRTMSCRVVTQDLLHDCKTFALHVHISVQLWRVSAYWGRCYSNHCLVRGSA